MSNFLVLKNKSIVDMDQVLFTQRLRSVMDGKFCDYLKLTFKGNYKNHNDTICLYLSEVDDINIYEAWVDGLTLDR